MFVYTETQCKLVNLDHVGKLVVHYDGVCGWHIIACLVGEKDHTVLSEHISRTEAEHALRKICDALKAGYSVYDVQRQTEL